MEVRAKKKKKPRHKSKVWFQNAILKHSQLHHLHPLSHCDPPPRSASLPSSPPTPFPSFIFSPYIKQNLGLVIYYRVRLLFLSLWNIVSLSKVTMSEAKTQIESIRKWVVEHKLRTVGNFLNLALHSFFLIDGCLILLISILLWFFAIVIWIRVSMAQWYYGFDRLQLVSTQHEN